MKMKQLIKEFPLQLIESLGIANNVQFQFSKKIENIIICGLGGSGIGGEIIRQWQLEGSTIPIHVCHNYFLPNFASTNTLVIACSYSGNTEETLAAVTDALERETMLMGITSGGKLKQILTKANKSIVTIPGGLPPRAALAYPLVQLANIFDSLDLNDQKKLPLVLEAIDFLNEQQGEIIAIAQKVADTIETNNILLYAEEQFKPILLRGCQQMNENAKTLAFHNVVPEMNHNEIVGWAKAPKSCFTIFFRSNLEHPSNAVRLNLTTEIVNNKTKDVLSIETQGKNLVEQSLYAIHLLDWLSLSMAENKAIDAMEVTVIDNLKTSLESKAISK